jgi:enoyl-CoA hydratase
MMGQIQLERTETLATIVLDNPTRRNAFTLEMLHQLTAIAADLATSSAKVVVLRGRGDLAFGSGADFSAFGSGGSESDFLIRFNESPSSAHCCGVARGLHGRCRAACLVR